MEEDQDGAGHRPSQGGDRVKAYWALGSDKGNFGDLLTPLIFKRYGITLDWVEREHAELFAVGSIAELIPQDFAGVVLGTGCMFEDAVEFPMATVLALRGVMTARLAGLHPPLLADLGLLAPDLIARQRKRDMPVGTVRAGGDPRPPMGLWLDPLDGNTVGMIEQAARCRSIVSSSLHGIVLADALGIVNMWDPYPTAPPFKFRDYASAYGERIEPFTWRLADQAQVKRKQAALRVAIGGLS
jgi:pyruvyltransferase